MNKTSHGLSISCLSVLRSNYVTVWWKLLKSLFYIIQMHLDMIITIETVYMWCGIDEHVNVRQWKFVFWACFVKVAKFYEEMDLTILFLDQNNIASQVGCWIGLMKTISNSFWTSCLISWSSSSLNWHGSSIIFSWCVTYCGSSLEF